MAKSKNNKNIDFRDKKESDRLKEIDEFIPLDPATEKSLEQFENIEDYWRAMEKIQKIKKKEAEEEKRKKVKEILAQEEKELENKDPETMNAIEKFYWNLSNKPKEPLQPSKSYKKD